MSNDLSQMKRDTDVGHRYTLPLHTLPIAKDGAILPVFAMGDRVRFKENLVRPVSVASKAPHHWENFSVFQVL